MSPSIKAGASRPASRRRTRIPCTWWTGSSTMRWRTCRAACRARPRWRSPTPRSRMPSVWRREAMRQEELPATTQLVSFKWKAFDLQGLRSLVSQQGGEQAFVLVTQVPLRREAVQLFLSGPADQEARGQTLLSETLASLEGESNWLTSTERAGRLGTAAGWWIGIAVAVIAVLVWKRRRRAA